MTKKNVERTMARLALTAVSALVFAWSPAMADVCGDVSQAVAEAPSGFASFRGEPQRGTSRPRWVVNRRIAGMGCVIGEETASREKWLECGAESPQIASIQQRHRELVAALKACRALRVVADRRASESSHDVEFAPAAGGTTQIGAYLSSAVDYNRVTHYLLRLKLQHRQ
jgi:hypothetical protein